MFLDNVYSAVSPCPLNSVRPAVDTLHVKGSGFQNEDVLLVSPPLYGVFDGATSLDGRCYIDGRTGGRLAADIAAATFSSAPGTLVEKAAIANDRIHQALRTEGIGPEERHRFWSTSMAVVKPEDDLLHFCQTGDAHILLIDDEGRPKLLSREIDIDGETLRSWQNVNAPSGTSIHDLLADEIRQVRLEMNRSYGVLNGEPEALDFLHHGTVSLNEIRYILLFTDGILHPQKTPGTPQDWWSMTERFLHGGLAGIHRHVRTLQAGDPECRLFPRFKCHDDIAAVALTVA